MIGRCCADQPAARRLAGRISRITAPILPTTLLVLLPKCPLCLAALLTGASGVSFSATSAAWVRGGIVLLWIAAAASAIWRRAFGRAPASG